MGILTRAFHERQAGAEQKALIKLLYFVYCRSHLELHASCKRTAQLLHSVEKVLGFVTANQTLMYRAALRNEVSFIFRNITCKGSALLKKDTNITNTAEKEQITVIISQFKETLNKINECPLPNSGKIQALNIMCMSKLNFYFPNMSFPEYVLKEIEDLIVDSIRSWFDLNTSSTRSFMFTPKCH